MPTLLPPVTVIVLHRPIESTLQSCTLFAFAESRKQNVSIELARVKRILF
jgi:hypothetical protein